ncbi:serine/threonine-protein kinase [Actinocorallia longicatena]|uniref:non-specific serine/threonine protein kinase n=1 Tax=Actinocorallia longicatena TaxID=111803 RepID=A0ABP6QBT4_9ACTN
MTPLSVVKAPGYLVEKRIGRGAFADVLRARHEASRRTVALKVLREQPDDAQRLRFAREFAAARRLSGHPNVVELLAHGELEDGRPYLVTEYCEAGSLADRLAGAGPLPLAEVVPLAVKVAEALAEAHGAGILHRDIKPANLLVTRDEPAALADFGIAALTSDDAAPPRAATPAYAPPELLDADYRGPTPAGDVYSLGATLYALLSGRPPHHPGRPLPAYALRSHYVHARETPIPPLPDVPEPVMAVLHRSLHRDPAARYATAAGFRDALRDCPTRRG